MAVKSGKNTKIISRFKAGLTARIKGMGLKQADVARILNINTGVLSKILSHGASAATMEEVAEKLGFDLVDLLTEGRAILEGDAATQTDKNIDTEFSPEQQIAIEAFKTCLRIGGGEVQRITKHVLEIAKEKQPTEGFKGDTKKRLSA